MSPNMQSNMQSNMMSFDENPAVDFDKGTYEEMIRDQGAIAAEGLQGLAAIAAMGGNDLVMEQGAGRLNESYKLPLHPGKSAVIDAQAPAKYINDAA